MNKRIFSQLWCSIGVLICIGMASINADDKNEMSNKAKAGVGLTTAAVNQLDESEAVLVEPLLQFSGDLFRAVKQDKQNAILSPLSVHSALNMLLLGAESNSQTETELLNVLGYMSNTGSAKRAHESYAKILSIFREITAIGLNKPKDQKPSAFMRDPKPPVVDVWTMGIVKGGSNLMPNYLEQTKKFYNSSIKVAQGAKSDENRKLVDEINKWAKEAGFKSGVINQGELEKDFSMLLLSAIRVQAFWFEEFYEHDVDELFYNHGLRNQLIKNATGMTISDFKGKFYEFTRDQKSKYREYNENIKSTNSAAYQELANLEFRVIQLPLIGNLSFTIFEPLKNGTGGELAKLMEQLLAHDQNNKQSKLSQALKMIDSVERMQKIQFLQMPKFTFESDISLKPSLMSLGLKRVFDSKAELTKLSAVKHQIDEVKHQAVIEVNHQGVKASGITTVHIVPLSLNIYNNPIRLRVQNPFMFVLRYSKVPLFIGQLVHL